MSGQRSTGNGWWLEGEGPLRRWKAVQFDMANLSLVYGLRLLPEGELEQVGSGSIRLRNGREEHVTLHLLEGSKEEIEAQLKQSIDAFFDIYPEIQ